MLQAAVGLKRCRLVAYLMVIMAFKSVLYHVPKRVKRFWQDCSSNRLLMHRLIYLNHFETDGLLRFAPPYPAKIFILTRSLISLVNATFYTQG